MGDDNAQKLEAEHRGQFDQIVDAQLPVLAELRRAGVIQSVFQWPTHEDRLQPAVPRRHQVAGVRRRDEQTSSGRIASMSAVRR